MTMLPRRFMRDAFSNGCVFSPSDFVIPDYRGMADRADLSYIWPDDLHVSTTIIIRFM